MEERLLQAKATRNDAIKEVFDGLSVLFNREAGQSQSRLSTCIDVIIACIKVAVSQQSVMKAAQLLQTPLDFQQH